MIQYHRLKGCAARTLLWIVRTICNLCTISPSHFSSMLLVILSRRKASLARPILEVEGVGNVLLKSYICVR